MQQLSFLEAPVPDGTAPVWNVLDGEQRAKAIAMLARLIAKTIAEPEQEQEQGRSCVNMTKITTDHLRRCAVVYVRQSSSTQVENNRESTARQYHLAERAVELGWPRDQVKVLRRGSWHLRLRPCRPCWLRAHDRGGGARPDRHRAGP